VLSFVRATQKIKEINYNISGAGIKGGDIFFVFAHLICWSGESERGSLAFCKK